MQSSTSRLAFGVACALAGYGFGRQPRVASAACGTALVAAVAVGASRRSTAPPPVEPPDAFDELLTNTAHELRTPLTVVMASIGMLRDGLTETDDERGAALEQATAACHMLVFLINDLVDEAAADAGKLRLDVRRCPVQDLVRTTRELLEPIAHVRGMALDLQVPAGPLAALADAMRLQQVLFNLVGNALKYGPDDTRVELRVLDDDEHVRFEVRDAGPGIPERLRDRLFERFSRVHVSGDRAVVGSGIGLHVCRLLVERMGGRIGYREPEDGRGAVFWFDVPAARVTAPESALAAST